LLSFVTDGSDKGLVGVNKGPSGWGIMSLASQRAFPLQEIREGKELFCLGESKKTGEKESGLELGSWVT
jgi:hypothetical protein